VIKIWVFNGKIKIFQGVFGVEEEGVTIFGGKSRQEFEELLIVGLHSFSFEN
jgi:hypothetical protein